MARRLLVALLVLASLLLAGPVPAVADKSGPLAFVLQPFVQIDNPVEQQTDWPFPDDPAEWVVNPLDFDCAWDVDDHWQYLGSGYLAAGGSASLAQCFVSDPTSIYRTVYGTTAWWSTQHKYLAVQVLAGTSALDVSVCYQPQGRCFAPRPVASGRGWAYESCTQVAYAPGTSDPAVGVIPGSQGGLGVVTTVTLTVTNPTARTVRDIRSGTGPSWAESFSGMPGCLGRVGDIVEDYPYRFWVS